VENQYMMGKQSDKQKEKITLKAGD